MEFEFGTFIFYLELGLAIGEVVWKLREYYRTEAIALRKAFGLLESNVSISMWRKK